jgi:flagellar biosynthesis/type III secretory pathway M-ring protein FliF/YscJ
MTWAKKIIFTAIVIMSICLLFLILCAIYTHQVESKVTKMIAAAKKANKKSKTSPRTSYAEPGSADKLEYEALGRGSTTN